MTEQQRDVEAYRQRFRHVDIKSPESLRSWFKEVQHLGSSSMALIACVPQATISKWRRRAGLSTPQQRTKRTGVRYRPVHNLKPPEGGWKDPDWLIPAYQLTRSVQAISEVVGIHKRTIRSELRKLGVPPLGSISHPCNDRAWIEKHYIKGLQSASECARLAGVSKVTMIDWITRHGVAVRTQTELACSKRNGREAQIRLWARDLAHNLSKQDIVRAVQQMEAGLVVRYKTGLKEIYWIGKRKSGSRSFAITRENSRLKRVPRVHYQYPGTDLTRLEHEHQLAINQREWADASLMERRVAAHAFLLKLRSTRPDTYTLPESVLVEAWEGLQTSPAQHYIYKHVLRTVVHKRGRCLPNYAWPLITHFVNLRPELASMWARPKHILGVLGRLVLNETELTTRNVLIGGSTRFGPKMVNPNLYRCLFQSLKIKGAILDLEPGIGCKALACATEKLLYRTIQAERFDQACERGLARFVGLDWQHYAGEMVELVLADGCLTRTVDVSTVLNSYAKRASRIVCFVKSADRQDLQERFKPCRVLGVKPSLYSRKLDYLFVW